MFGALKLNKSKDVNKAHPENIESIFSTMEFPKLFIISEDNNEQLTNIFDICLTFGTVNVVKFKNFNFLQFLNIFFIFSTILVLKLLTCKSDNSLQSENIDDISLTFGVSNESKYKLVNFAQL